MLRAVVFDLDGTLVDSLEDIAIALDASLKEHQLATPVLATLRTWVGGGARNLIEQAVHALAPGREDALVEPVLARFRVHYAAAPIVHTYLYPKLAPVLDDLVAAGLALAVLSNKPHALTVAICERLLAPWPFAQIEGHRDGMPLKPDPTAALALARSLAVPPDACAFVGDSGVDIRTARAAGMTAVGVTWGYRPRADLEGAGAALIVDDPAQLRTLAAG